MRVSVRRVGASRDGSLLNGTGALVGSLEVGEGARASAHRYSASALRPGQSPFIAADWPSWPESDSGVETSMPAQKFFPAAQSTTTRTSSSSSIHRMARGISSHMEASMALDFRGRFRRTTPTCAARSTSSTSVSKLGGWTIIVATEPSRAPRCESERLEDAKRPLITYECRQVPISGRRARGRSGS